MSLRGEALVPDRPRIIHVTTSHLADDVRIFERECTSLARQGIYDVYLAAPGTIAAESGIVHLRLRAVSKGRLARFLAGHRTARRLVRSLEFDLWHIHDPELIPIFVKIARAGQKVVWDAHEDYEEQFVSGGAKAWVPRPLRGLARHGMRALLARIDNVAAGVVVATPRIATRYRNPRTAVVGNEARIETFLDCSPDFDSRQLLFTGHPGPSHLFPQIVRALVDLPDVKLVVAGRPPAESEWAPFKQQLGDRLSHVGWLGRQELAAQMSLSALGLLTYANTRAYDVASPTKGFEFAAAGLPVIASPNGMNKSLLGRSHGGFLASDFGWESIQREIVSALSDRSIWADRSKAARVWAHNEGSWSGSEDRLLALYNVVLRNKEQ